MTTGRALKVTEVADELGVDKMTVYRRIWARELGYTNIAKAGAKRPRFRVTQQQLDAYLKTHGRAA